MDGREQRKGVRVFAVVGEAVVVVDIIVDCRVVDISVNFIVVFIGFPGFFISLPFSVSLCCPSLPFLL